MTIVSDCSYSGQWITPWVQYLERKKIQPCVHSSKKQRVYLSLITSCRGFETASTLLMAIRVFCNSSSGGNSIHPYNCRIDDGQHTHCCITTMKTCTADFDAPCSLPPDYTWAKRRLDERIFLMRNRTYTKWAVVALTGPSEDINDQIRRSRIEDLEDYGNDYVRILYSGKDRRPSIEKVVKVNNKFPMNNIRLNL